MHRLTRGNIGIALTWALLWGGVAFPGATAGTDSLWQDTRGTATTVQMAQSSQEESYTIRQGFPHDGTRFDIYDRSGRRKGWVRESISSTPDFPRWDVYDEQGRRTGTVRGNGSSSFPRWDLYDERGRRTGTVRQSGLPDMPRWEMYDDQGRRVGTARPSTLDMDYFRKKEGETRRVPAVPAIPPIPQPSPGWQGTTTPQPRETRQWPIPGPWIQPPAYPGSGVQGSPVPRRQVSTPPIPAIPPPPPGNLPPGWGAGTSGPPLSPSYPSYPSYPSFPAFPSLPGSTSNAPGYGHGNPYQGYGHGNPYQGYGHGNTYDGFGHGGIYAMPDAYSR